VVPLPQWQLVASQPLKAETVDLQAFGKLVLEGSIAISKMPLDIKMRYEVETDGDFKEFIKSTLISRFRSINHCLMYVSTKLGFYGLFVYQKRAYLNACINSRGGSTFTKEQFN